LDANPKAESEDDRQGYAAFGHVVKGMDVVQHIYDGALDPEKGEGAMKGQMLAVPVKILTVRRWVGPWPARRLPRRKGSGAPPSLFDLDGSLISIFGDRCRAQSECRAPVPDPLVAFDPAQRCIAEIAIAAVALTFGAHLPPVDGMWKREAANKAPETQCRPLKCCPIASILSDFGSEGGRWQAGLVIWSQVALSSAQPVGGRRALRRYACG
jgi:hypothetical protein